MHLGWKGVILVHGLWLPHGICTFPGVHLEMLHSSTKGPLLAQASNQVDDLKEI